MFESGFDASSIYYLGPIVVVVWLIHLGLSRQNIVFLAMNLIGRMSFVSTQIGVPPVIDGDDILDGWLDMILQFLLSYFGLNFYVLITFWTFLLIQAHFFIKQFI